MRDIVVASIHWGRNWGYEVPPAQRRFARWLLDGGVDIVHGHSSHHVRPIELYRDKLILYGCGNRARTADAEWLARTLARISEPFNAHIGLAADGSLGLRAG